MSGAEESGLLREPARRRREPLSLMPIRLRLTVIFAVAMACVLAVSGVVIFARVRAQVDDHLNFDVGRQARALLAQGVYSGVVQAIRDDDAHVRTGVAEIMDARGRVLVATPGSGDVRLLTRDQLRMALRHHLVSDRHRHESRDGLRLVSTPLRIPGHGPGVLVVGTPLDQRAASLTSLTVAMLIVGPIALLVVVAVGYRITAAALRPVELMRRQAATVQATEPGVRLPLPAADDEVRQLGLTLNAMLDRLETSLARERAFVANVSHELRTPLSNMTAELDLALRRPRTAPELVEALRSTQVEVDRLSAMAEDMLVLARADEDRFSISADRLAVDDLLEGVGRHFADGDRPIRVRGAERRLTIVADRRRIEQALINLVDNALRYGEGEVELSAQRDGAGMVEIHVRDEGPGFPSEFLDQAFERFSRADAGRAGRGTGLGLAIVRMIARSHGGDAHVANGEHGADAWMVIPGSRDA